MKRKGGGREGGKRWKREEGRKGGKREQSKDKAKEMEAKKHKSVGTYAWEKN